jgi:hypothetical protein
MLLANISPSKEDFDQCKWQSVVADSEKKECRAYVSLFATKAREAKEKEDVKAQEVFALLYHICSLTLKLDSPSEPFGPMAVFPSWRSAVIDDFDDAHLSTLEAIVTEVEDPELRARIADILWYRRRGDYRMAELAVKSYLEAAEVLESPVGWVSCVDRIERAVQLAVSLGKKNRPFTDAITYIEDLLDKHQGEDPLFLSAKLMEILQECRQGDPLKYAALAEKAASRAEAEEDGLKWHRARTYWEIKARWHAIGGDEDNHRESLIRAAETYVKQAEDALKHPVTPYSVAASFLRQAIEAFRRIEGTQERRQELHGKLLDYQKKSVAELKPFSCSVDISQITEEASNSVKGKTLHDSLFALAFLASSPNVSDLRKKVEERASKFGLDFAIPVHILDEKGKIKGRRPGIHEDESESERVLTADMFRKAVEQQNIIAQAIILPAVAQINIDHNARVSDLLSFASNNPFVPPGREYIFAKGLHAGLTGDLLQAAHLLVPQIEQSIRHLLERQGTIVSGLDDQSIQDEYTLNVILYKYKSELTEILGEDIVFDLQGLLVERFGSNLRNLIAHGLMDYFEFGSWWVLYLWWFTLRLCCLMLCAQIYRTSNARQEKEESNSSADGETIGEKET